MTVEEVNQLCKDTFIEHLGIEFIDVQDEFIVARMPVDKRTIQPMKLLHGGATMALAETIGSVGSYLITDNTRYDVVSLEINGNHIGNTNAEYVIATGKMVHKGQKTHVWDIQVNDQFNKPVSVCRLTNMIIDKRGG